MQNRALRICRSPVDLGMGRIRGESTDVSVPDASMYTSEQMLEKRKKTATLRQIPICQARPSGPNARLTSRFKIRGSDVKCARRGGPETPWHEAPRKLPRFRMPMFTISRRNHSSIRLRGLTAVRSAPPAWSPAA
jgi:hypothetical protein